MDQILPEYLDILNGIEPLTDLNGYRVLDLFAGCGGLALGFESIGFETTGFEMNADAVNSYKSNLTGACFEKIITKETVFPDADIIIGGPPCQPFSVGGKQLGLTDSRDGFPAFVSAVKQLRPRLWMFENVRGMLYKNRSYLDEVIESLNSIADYTITFDLVKMVNYQVPQNRERLIVIGHDGSFQFPTQFEKRYNAEHALSDIRYNIDENTRFLTASQDKYIAKYEKASDCVNPRDLYMDRPARTLTCRNLAGATGDMHRIKLPDGRRKRLTVLEASRLQGFPDWYNFSGSETSQFTQIGNAVPPLFSQHLARSILNYMNRIEVAPSQNTQYSLSI